MTIGERIKLLRKERGLRQDALARACGVTPSCLSRLEAGENESPQAELLRRLSRVLGVPSDYISDPGASVPYEPPPTSRPPRAGGRGRPGSAGRKALASGGAVGEITGFRVTREEKAFLERLRGCGARVQKLVYAVPGAPIETLSLLWQALYRPERAVAPPELTLERPRGAAGGSEGQRQGGSEGAERRRARAVSSPRSVRRTGRDAGLGPSPAGSSG